MIFMHSGLKTCLTGPRGGPNIPDCAISFSFRNSIKYNVPVSMSLRLPRERKKKANTAGAEPQEPVRQGNHFP